MPAQPSTPRALSGSSKLPLPMLGLVAAATTLSLLPGFLIGTLSFAIRDEFGFGETQLGALMLVYMGTSALTSAPLGGLVERVGAAAGLRWSLVSVAVCCFGIAWTAGSWIHLAGWLLFAGVGSAGVYPSTNLAIVRVIDYSRQGITFGIKQASIPAATFLGGLAVPLVDIAIGWRGVFIILGTSLLVVAWVSTRVIGHVHGGAKTAVATRLSLPPLVLLAIGAALAVGAIQPIAVFGVPYAVELELSAAFAGSALAVASAFGVAMRVITGAAADRWPHTDLFRVVAVFLVIGATSMVLLASATTLGAFAGALAMAIAIGWSWNGMFHFAVVRSHPSAPAAASSITQAGLLAGVAVGPVIFGAVAEYRSYAEAWRGCAAAMILGGVLLMVGGRMLREKR